MCFFNQIVGLVSLLNSADLEWGRDPGCRHAGRGLALSPKTRYINPSSSPLVFPSASPASALHSWTSAIAEAKRKLGFVPFLALSPLAAAGLHGSVSHGWSSPGAHVPQSMTAGKLILPRSGGIFGQRVS